MSQKYVKTYVPLSILVIGFILGGISLHAVPPAITLVPFETGFTNPIGIDFHQDVLNSENGIGDLIISTNYPTGIPHNLDLIQVPSGTHVPYSILNGLTEELKIATVRTTLGCQEFPVGDVFTGTGKPGEIVRIDQDGNFSYPAVSGAPLTGGGHSWVQLPDEPNLLRGSLYVDRTCVFGGDLIVVTGSDPGRGGDVWRVNAAGATTFVANILGASTPQNVGPHLEGVITVPCSVNVLNQPCPAGDSVWGPWAGTILIGNEGNADDLSQDGLVFTVTPGGVVTAYSLAFTENGVHHPMKTEDLDLIEGGNSFFGVNYGNQRVLRAAKQDFTTFVDKILLTQELPCGSSLAVADCPGVPHGSHATTGLYVVSYVGAGGNAVGGLFNVTPLTTAGGVSDIDQWEHVTFAPLGNPRLRVVKTPDNGTFPFHGQASFTIMVTNFGFDDATNVHLTDALPGNGGLVWVTATTTQGTCVSPIVGNALDCALGTLALGASATVTVSTAATTPAAACQPQLNPAAIATADGDVTGQDGGSLTCTPPPVALFVIGDVEPHDIGSSVNFWGAQWWKNNQMSGFVAKGVASFKGFADQSTNVCGGTWTSLPGNSSDPPQTIPDDVAIIVTDTVVKDGPNISGTIKQILIVHQDGGYGPNPGHAGNGPVTSILCP